MTARVPVQSVALVVLLAIASDVLGRHVASLIDGFVGPGQHTIAWSPRLAARGRPTAGIYFIRLTMAGESGVTRVVVLN